MFDEDRDLLSTVFDKQRVYMDSLCLNQIRVEMLKIPVQFIWQVRDGITCKSLSFPGSAIIWEASGLWVSDPELSRMLRFNAIAGELHEATDLTSLVTQSDISKSGEMTDITPVDIISQNCLLVTTAGERNPAYQPEWKIQYASIATPKNSPEVIRLFDGMAKRCMVGVYAGRPTAITLSINEQPLIDFQIAGLIYAANSADFNNRVFSPDGTLLRTYVYPYDRLELNTDEDIFRRTLTNRQLLMVWVSAKYPEFWPALYRMFMYDEQRLWISTVTEGRVKSEWFVIDDRNQMLITRFI